MTVKVLCQTVKLQSEGLLLTDPVSGEPALFKVVLCVIYNL